MNALATVPAAAPTAEPTLRLFASVPRGFRAHAVTDRECLPLIAPGEVAIVTDQTAHFPESGNWYLMEYTLSWSRPGGRERRGHCINLLVESPRPASQGPGTWWHARRPAAGRPGEFVCSDGPYDDFVHLADRILGRVVGIYAPHRVAANPTDQEQWEMLRPGTPWPYATPMLPPAGRRRAA